MPDYIAPLADMRFVLHELADAADLLNLPGCEEVSADLIDAVLEEGGKFASSVLAPLNASGDRAGADCVAGVVSTAPGWQAAYRQFVEAGWNGVAGDIEFGGQGLPETLAAPLMEMWCAANMAFSLCPMLTHGAISAVLARGSQALKARYVPKMLSGEWTGTMNLTEPQAGSDLAAVRCKAVPEGDHYRISGQKIFITYGEHDLTDNIIHLVLARLPDAPEGVKGISLFVVPKYRVNEDGSLGARNDVHCVSIEHKLGIHASPTCVMSFGDQGGAWGELVGEPHRGLEIMFIMMNAARFAVGMEGVGLAERATQQAMAFARGRVQGAEAGAGSDAKVAIIRHPDVQRMLMMMRAQTEAMRAVAYVVAAAVDRAHRHADEQERQHQQAFVDLMIPVVKAWCTETCIEVASLGIQVHGGVGYVEETGAAQHLRDARITTIYEGTTGIQANDFVSRKIARDKGAAIAQLIAAMAQTAAECRQAGADLAPIGEQLEAAAAALQRCVALLLRSWSTQVPAVLAGAVPLLMLTGIACGGWQMARAALSVQQNPSAVDADFARMKIATARFYANHVLIRAQSLVHEVHSAADALVCV